MFNILQKRVICDRHHTCFDAFASDRNIATREEREIPESVPSRTSNSIKERNCLLVQGPFRSVENEQPRKDERKWKIMREPCCRCYRSKGKTRKVKTE